MSQFDRMLYELDTTGRITPEIDTFDSPDDPSVDTGGVDCINPMLPYLEESQTLYDAIQEAMLCLKN